MDNRSSSVLRMVAGAYVLYQAYGIITGVISGDAGSNPTILIIAAILFVIFGGWILVMGIRGMKKSSEEPDEETEDDDDDFFNETEEVVEEVLEEETEE